MPAPSDLLDFWCECEECGDRWREEWPAIGSLRCRASDCGSKNVDCRPVCRAPQCPTPDLCGDSEACSWPRKEITG